MAVALDRFFSAGTGLEEMAQPIEKVGLLEKLGGVLTSGKEKLHAAGRTLKQNADLILFGAVYPISVALGTNIILHTEPTANVQPEGAYLAFAVMAISLGAFYAQLFYNRFTTGDILGIGHGRL